MVGRARDRTDDGAAGTLMSSRARDLLIATLGTEPQVVTIAVDGLQQKGYPIAEVCVVHTAAEAVNDALAVLAREFERGAYPDVVLRTVPVIGAEGPLDDFRDERAVSELLGILYREVRQAKRLALPVHLCISGGRKVMAIAGMVVAQLLFGPDDRVWHVLSEHWRPGSKRRMHLAPNEKMWLVNVPVLRWTDSVALLRSIADLDDPIEAIRRYEAFVRSEQMRRRQEFVRRWLTRAEAEVVRLACAGLDNATIARRLRKSERTVANQLTSVYAKLSDWLGSPLRQPDRSVLIAELAPYFGLLEAGIENVVPTKV